ncbi:hypothetical protein [Teichococcus aestuarii]|uniref:hypothetical protein n=1 Tax=Teichococcus aestuarii TaxID=568898 RepID=UPI00361823B5
MAGSMELSLRLCPGAQAVPVLLDRLEAYAEETGLPMGPSQRLALVCEEWLANVAMHGTGASYAELSLWREPGACICAWPMTGRPSTPGRAAARHGPAAGRAYGGRPRAASYAPDDPAPGLCAGSRLQQAAGRAGRGVMQCDKERERLWTSSRSGRRAQRWRCWRDGSTP